MSNLYRGHSKDASYQDLIHLAKRFQRRFFQKSTNQKQEWPVVAMFVNGSGQNYQSWSHDSPVEGEEPYLFWGH
jgi:hypothetical protein